jgi:chaperonin GroES
MVTLLKSPLRYRPVGGHVFVREYKKPASRGGILMPDSVESTLCEGLVLLTGPGRLQRNAKTNEDRVTPNVKKGDRVVYTRHAAICIDDESPDIFLVGEDSIIAVRTEIGEVQE